MIKIHVLRAGRVLVSPHLSFGGESCSTLKASGLLLPKERRVWLPVSAYLIEHPRGLVLLDTGWSREMSPAGAFDAAAQRASLEWIRATAADHRRIETLANHDTEVKPHVIELP